MKNIKYFVGAVCLALSLNSCSDFLNEEPVSEIPAGDMWQTVMITSDKRMRCVLWLISMLSVSGETYLCL